jgi:excisionase family DNA binding protein
MLTIRQVAELLHVSERTVRRRIATGALPVLRDGRVLRVPVAALDDYLTRNTTSYVTPVPPRGAGRAPRQVPPAALRRPRTARAGPGVPAPLPGARGRVRRLWE